MDFRSLLSLTSLCLLSLSCEAHANPTRVLATQFAYTAIVPASPPGIKAVDVWLPIPSDSAWQTITDLTVTAPTTYQITTEKHYGNRIVYVHDTNPAKPLKVTVQFTAARKQVSVLGVPSSPAFSLASDLAPDSRIPVGGRFADIAKQVTFSDQTCLEKEHDLFRHVVATMHYDYKKSSPEYAQGDSAFVCDYKSGNCSDLHSYLISLSRTLGIPAVLEFGFPLSGIPVPSPVPTDGKVGGYHCWVWFQDPQKGWIPLDAAALAAGRMPGSKRPPTRYSAVWFWKEVPSPSHEAVI